MDVIIIIIIYIFHIILSDVALYICTNAFILYYVYLYRDINIHNIHFISFKYLLCNRVTWVTPWASLDYDIVEKMHN